MFEEDVAHQVQAAQGALGRQVSVLQGYHLFDYLLLLMYIYIIYIYIYYIYIWVAPLVQCYLFSGGALVFSFFFVSPVMF